MRERVLRIRVALLLLVLLTAGLVPAAHAQDPTPSPKATAAGSRPGLQVSMGREWRPTLLPPTDAGIWTPDVTSLTAWDGGFAALGARVARRNRNSGESLWLSEDGESWERIHSPFEFSSHRGDVQHILGFRGGLIAVGADGMRFAAWRSRDGRTWRRVPDQPAFARPLRVPATTYALYLGAAIDGHERLVVSGTYMPGGGDREHFERVWSTRNGRDWSGGRRRGGAATAADDTGFVGLTMVRRWPRGVDCDYGTLYEVARSKDGRKWRRVPGSLLPCGAYGGIAYHSETDAYFVVRDTFGIPEVLRSRNLKRWTAVPLDKAMFGHPKTEWWPERIEVDDGLIVIVGGSSQNRMWSLISSDGHEWEFSTGWPAMYDLEGIYGVAIDRGRIVAVTQWRQSRAWVADAGLPRATRPPGLIDDCLSHDDAICLAIEAAIEHRVQGRLIEKIEFLGEHVCPRLSPDCPRPTRGEQRRYVEGAEVWLEGAAVPILGNVWLPRANGGRPPRFDIVSAGQCTVGLAGWPDRIDPVGLRLGPACRGDWELSGGTCLALGSSPSG